MCQSSNGIECLQGLYITPASLEVKQVSVVLQFVPVSLVVCPRLMSSFPKQESLLVAASEKSRQIDWFVSVSTDRSKTSRQYDIIITVMWFCL